MKFLGNLFSSQKENQLFLYFNDAANYGFLSSQMLCTLCENPSRQKEYSKQIRDIEHDCDQTIKQIHGILNDMFLLPFSHEELKELASHLDSIVDCVQGAVSRIASLYELPEIEKEEELLKAAKTICNMTESIKTMILNLRNLKKVKGLAQIIDRLHAQENEIDDFCDKAKARWHKASQENLEKISLRTAWVEVYEHLDWAGNRCLDVADIVGGILQRWS